MSALHAVARAGLPLLILLGFAAAPASAQIITSFSPPGSFTSVGQNLPFTVHIAGSVQIDTLSITVQGAGSTTIHEGSCTGIGVSPTNVDCSGTYTVQSADATFGSFLLTISGSYTGTGPGGAMSNGTGVSPKTVANHTTSISISQSPSPITPGGSGTVTLTVTSPGGGTPTGNITYNFNSTGNQVVAL